MKNRKIKIQRNKLIKVIEDIDILLERKVRQEDKLTKEYRELQDAGHYPKDDAQSIIFNGDKYTVHKNEYGSHLYKHHTVLEQWVIWFDGYDAKDYGWSKKDIAFLKKELGNFVTEVNW